MEKIQSPLQLLDTTSLSFGHSPDVRRSPPERKSGFSWVVKMMEKINNMGGNQRVGERAGSPLVLLEQPFIKTFKLLGNLFLYPFSRVVKLQPGRPVAKGNGLSVT